MKQLLTFLLFVAFSGLIPIACIDPCGSGGPVHFVIDELGLHELDDKYGPLEGEDTVVSFDQFQLALIVEQFEVVSIANDQNGTLFSQPLQACSPAPAKAVNFLKELQILAAEPIIVSGDTLYHAGDNVDHLFSAGNYHTEYEIAETVPYMFENYHTLYLKLKNSFTATTLLDLRVRAVLDDEQVIIFENIRRYIR